MHTYVSGLGDYLAEDDRDAIRIAREILASIDWDRGMPATSAARAFKPPRYDAEELLGVMPMDPKRPVDMQQVIARIADDSEFLRIRRELRQRHRRAATSRSKGMPLGVITNNGPIDSRRRQQGDALHPGLLPVEDADPLPQNTTGYMVGKAHEEAGMIKHGAKMIQAVTNATVPQITLYCGASFGAGNYGMCGRGFASALLLLVAERARPR